MDVVLLYLYTYTMMCLLLSITKCNIAFMNLLSLRCHETKVKIPILNNSYMIKVINGENNHTYFLINKNYACYIIILQCLNIIP